MLTFALPKNITLQAHLNKKIKNEQLNPTKRDQAKPNMSLSCLFLKKKGAT